MSGTGAATGALAGLPPLREVIARHGLSARKRLGQHFLLDMNLVRRIVRAAGPLDGTAVIEIGAGPGGLTRALLESEADRVIAVERDRRCLAALGELAAVAGGRLAIVAGDATAVDPTTLAPPPRAIVANLPYNVGTRLLVGWLPAITSYRALTLMFQKEVADRLAAGPGSKAYGRLSVLVQWQCTLAERFDVAPDAFVPPPQVTSTVLTLVPRRAPLAPAPREALARVTAVAFGQRRKMLRSALAPLGGAALLARAGIDETARAEELTIEQFCALARELADDGATPTDASADAG